MGELTRWDNDEPSPGGDHAVGLINALPIALLRIDADLTGAAMVFKVLQRSQRLQLGYLAAPRQLVAPQVSY